MRPCWSCGVQDEECIEPCDCAKCVDPEGYQYWREENPDQYQEWLDEQLDG